MKASTSLITVGYMQDPAIYIVDDDSDDSFLLREAIEDLGNYSVVEFNSGADLIDSLISDSSQNVNLLFVDMNMPRMDGLETVRALRTSPIFNAFPVVMFSTSADKQLIDSAYVAGFDLCCSKPNSMEDLRSTICQVLTKFL
jgi:CheY-like chemotaxis protein